jgi:hypothetical protein
VSTTGLWYLKVEEWDRVCDDPLRSGGIVGEFVGRGSERTRPPKRKASALILDSINKLVASQPY